MLRLHEAAEDGPSPLGAAVFVHGLDGDVRATWSQNGPEPGFWPNWSAREWSGANVYTFEYPVASSRWRGSAMPFSE